MMFDEIIYYVTNTPENTNPNILKEMLNELVSSSGGGGGSSEVFGVYCADWNADLPVIDVAYADLVAAMEAEKHCVLYFYDYGQEYAAAIVLYSSDNGPIFTYAGEDYYIGSDGGIYFQAV